MSTSELDSTMFRLSTRRHSHRAEHATACEYQLYHMTIQGKTRLSTRNRIHTHLHTHTQSSLAASAHSLKAPPNIASGVVNGSRLLTSRTHARGPSTASRLLMGPSGQSGEKNYGPECIVVDVTSPSFLGVSVAPMTSEHTRRHALLVLLVFILYRFGTYS